MRVNQILSICCVCLLSISCATLPNYRQKYPITIYSTPNHIPIRVIDKNNKTIAKLITPDTLYLPKVSKSSYFKKPNYTIIIDSTDDYQKDSCKIDYRVSVFYWGNILFIPISVIGLFIVDPLTGAMWRPNTKELHFELKGKERID